MVNISISKERNTEVKGNGLQVLLGMWVLLECEINTYWWGAGDQALQTALQPLYHNNCMQQAHRALHHQYCTPCQPLPLAHLVSLTPAVGPAIP